MASKRRRHNSAVGDVIKFEPLEDPPWRQSSKETKVPSVSGMIADIVRFQQEWISEKENSDVGAIQKDFLEKFIFHCGCEEDHGCGTLEDTKECLDSERDYSELNPIQKETMNMKNAYEYLLDVKETETDTKCHGLIEESMLRLAHKIIMKDACVKSGQTKPGKYSNLKRITEFEGERYEYQQPSDMHVAVNSILDKFNSLYAYEDSQNHEADLQDSQWQKDDENKLCKLFKSCSWLVFEMLDLHPFGDGNGRLCRLLCSYVLSTCTPFPTPMYNIWSTSCKNDYKKALVAARKCEGRHPKALATMIIECSWHGWKEFMNSLTKKG